MFKLSTRDRLSRWREFRLELDSLSLDLAVDYTSKFWTSCPFNPYYLDLKQPNSWPDPWQLIEENYYCDLAKTLGIVYTLYLTKHGPQLQPEIKVYLDKKTRYQYHIADFCHGKYVLNLIEGQVVNKEHINQELKLLRSYTARDLQLEKY